MAEHCDGRNLSKHLTLLALLFLLFGAITLLSDTASAQQQRLQVPGQTTTTPDTPTAAPPSPAIGNTSALGQALAACNQAAVQETFTLPGLKGEVTLDRCYKGRAHLICSLTALSKEAKSLAGSYSKIVDANYPDINTVEGICQVNPEILASNIVGTEDFAKRFKELKSQYDATTNCAANVGQAFKNVTFADLTQAPEVIKSMTASIDGDVANVSKVHEQISALAEKMERANKAMKTITKLYHAMCLQGERAAEKSRPK
jgi:hypothetical protein